MSGRSPGGEGAAARWGWPLGFAAWLGIVALLLFGDAMVTDFNYDEDQYIAAGVLATRLRLYADFLYLQPPVWPLLLAALFEITGGHYLLAARVLTALLALGACLLLLAILRCLGAGRGLAVLLVSACVLSPFLIGPMSQTRNDILPLVCFLAGLWATLEADRRPARQAGLMAAAGLCMGLAAATKLSYGFAPLVLLLHAVWHADGWRAALRARMLPAVAGGALPAALCLFYLATATEPFLYGVLHYHLTAPIAWYTETGQAALLGAPYRAGRLLLFAVVGGNGSLVLLAATLAVIRWRQRRPGQSFAADPAAFRLVLLMAGLAAVFGFLPRPSWPMYYAPLAPLLACCVACLHGAVRPAGIPRAALLAAVLLALVALPPRVDAVRRLFALENWAGLAANRQAREIRDALDAAGVQGHVATLFPMHVLDANALRPEFATGPFVFRSAHLLAPGQAAALNATGPAQLDALFAADPPAAIFAGIYADRWDQAMDHALSDHALRHGWVLLRADIGGSGVRGGRLYLRPAE